ncbi:Putative nuclear cap-binding protein subunit 3 [Septoria linicola]|uniref:Nuclear cap-binding protein subunit 3 n=1 Tax=Septoria linicola TaxID=215465 RepID=A0A9Q9B706_9PEZI|nr:putative nuclear cap-binding protein subunit 3 [Septoria linicola]USW58497.1 Putative nuclear cap-binding protein subunit 3 [Septoria linicola]
MATDESMDFEMDVDMDAEVDPELAAMQRAAAELNARPSMATEAENEQMNGVEGAVEDGELSQADIAATKVHIGGLGEMNTQDVENFARDHFPSKAFRRVEWVNDHSANLIYDTAEAASEALRTLAATPTVDDPLELRPAKASITHPQAELTIRQAVVTDQKAKNAAVQSAYYLNHPEYDPETRFGRGRGGGRGRARGRGRGRYERRERSRSTRSPTAEKPFDVNLYDDDAASLAARRPPTAPARRASIRSDEDLFAGSRSRRPRQEEDLFAQKSNGRLKDRSRSRSPARDGDGRFGFSDDQPYRQTARRRSPPPPRRRSSNENRSARESMKAELFPGKKSNGRSKSPVDLFAHKTSSGKHVLKDATASHYDALAAAVGNFDISPDRVQVTYDTPAAPRQSRDEKPRDLFAQKAAASQAGRLNGEPASSGFSIKGAGAKNEVSFLGASKERQQDLFPNRIAAGVDLFPEKVRRRKGASDFI